MLIYLVASAFLLGCTNGPLSEKWLGHYSFPNNDVEFPLYLSIHIEGARVSGMALDGSMEQAVITGSVREGRYELLLHPLKHGNDKSQDVHYRGKRTGDRIVGEWEHVAGVRGPWSSEITDLDAEEAIRLIRPPCKESEQSMGSDKIFAI
jgi:hypothetical protein